MRMPRRTSSCSMTVCSSPFTRKTVVATMASCGGKGWTLDETGQALTEVLRGSERFRRRLIAQRRRITCCLTLRHIITASLRGKMDGDGCTCEKRYVRAPLAHLPTLLLD